MITLTIVFSVFSIALAVYLYIVLPESKIPMLTNIIFVVLIVGVWGGNVELLSQPKPIHLEWRSEKFMKVLGAKFDEGVAIYLWGIYPNGVVPRSYEFPWSKEFAMRLKEAFQKSSKDGSGVYIRGLYEKSLEESDYQVFHKPPQPAQSPKRQEPDNFLQIPGVN
jgi:hypothetical protein